MESARLPHTAVVVVEVLGIGLADRGADAAVVGDLGIPREFWVRVERRLRDLGHQLHLADQMPRRRRPHTARTVDAGQAVIYRDRLRPGCLFVHLDAADHRQDEADVAMQEFGCD